MEVNVRCFPEILAITLPEISIDLCARVTGKHRSHGVHSATTPTRGRTEEPPNVHTYCRCFRPGGSLDRLVNLSLRVPAQMGWCEMEHKGKMSLVLSCTRVLVVGVTSVARERVGESE
jgi:hypothetical protein